MKLFTATALGLLLMASSIFAQESRQDTVLAREDLKRAEQLAERYAERFKETLDFAVLYREFFIIDPEKRALNAALFLDLKQHEELAKELSPAEVEQAFIGFMNLYYLVGLYHANVLTKEQEQSDEFKPEDIYPPELLQAVKEPSTCFFFSDFIKDASCRNSSSELFRTAADIRRFIESAKHLARLFRQYMPPQPFNSPEYKAYLRELVWDGQETSVDEGRDYFEIGEETTVYQTYREMFALDIVEEHGEMKVLSLPLGN